MRSSTPSFLARCTARAFGVGLATVLAAMPLTAQTGQIVGTVRDAGSLQPLEAAQVYIAGTGVGTLTQANGRYVLLNVPVGEVTLVAELVGRRSSTQTVTVTAGEAVVANFELEQTAIALDQIVVTGAGVATERRKLGNSIATIDPTSLENAPVNDFSQLLAGREPGVVALPSSGATGEGARIRIRGSSSLSQLNEPIIYVDGIRVDRSAVGVGAGGQGNPSRLDDIPPDAIERVEILKGAAAATLYGTEASNGVIQIFTKKGSPGTTELSIESEVGWEGPVEKAFFFPQTADLLYRNGMTQQYRITGSGGNDRTTWSFGGSVHDREGYRIDNNASRSYQARTGLTAQLRDNLRYSGSFAFGYNNYERSRDGNAGGYTPLWLLEGGRIFALGFNNKLNEASSQELQELGDYLNQAEALQNYRIKVARFQMSHQFAWEARDDLSFNATVGLDHRSSNERGIETNEFLIFTGVQPEGTDDRGSIEQYDRRFLGLTMEAGGQHRWERGPLSLVTSGGAQLFRDDDAQSERVALNVRDGSETVRGAGTTQADDYFIELVNYGVYLQQNWGFYDRYFLDLGLRADGNSAFGDEVGLQYYPKVGFSYDLGAEQFFQDAVPANVISNVRLRGNYGVAGNFPPPFANDRTVGFASYLGQQTAGFGQPGNPDLKPEKTHTLELGGELTALSGRVTLQVNWYDATTKDALFLVPLSPSTGEGTQLRNVGEITNSGTEFRFVADVIRNDRFTARLTGSYNTLNNEVTDAGGSPVFGISGFSSSTVQTVVQEGWPVGALRGTSSTLNADGSIAETQLLQYLGKPLPDKFGSLGFEVTVGDNLRFNADADWQTGAQLHSFNRQFRYLYGIDDPELPDALLTANPGPIRGNWLNLTNFFVEDTDYLRFRNIAVNYILPRGTLASWSDGIELGFSVQNPIGWWSSSFDPESDHSGAASQGAASVGGFNYASDPTPRTFLATVRVRF